MGIPGLALLALAGFAPQDTPDECRIHGRVLGADGEPLELAKVMLQGFRASAARVETFGLPKNWKDFEVFSDEEGRFELGFVPPQAYQFTVQVLHDEHSQLGWRWDRIDEGETIDLGEVALTAPAVIEGHVQASDGSLLVDGWFVQASLRERREETFGVPTLYAAVDPDTGAFRIDAMPPGNVEVHAFGLNRTRSETKLVRTVAGETQWVTIDFGENDPLTSIQLTISSRGPAGPATSELLEGAVRAIAADGSVHVFEKLPRRGWDYIARRVPDGLYSIEIEDPRFRPWVQYDVRRGEKVRAQLEGAAALHVDVVGPDGAPVPRYRVQIRPTEPLRTSRWIELLAQSQVPVRNANFEGLLPGAADIHIEADGYGEWRGEARGLAADEVVTLRAELPPPRRLVGRVVHADGRPATGGTIDLTHGEVPGHHKLGSSIGTSLEIKGELRSVSIGYRDATSDLGADGAFDLGPIGRGEAVLRVRIGQWFLEDVHVELADLDDPYELVLPPVGQIEGQLIFDGERPPGEVEVRLSEANGMRDWRFLYYEQPVGPVDTEGRFSIGPIQAASYRVSVQSGRGEGAPPPESFVRGMRLIEVTAGDPTLCEIDLGYEPPRGSARIRANFGDVTPDPAWMMVAPLDRFDSYGYPRIPAHAAVSSEPVLVEGLAAGRYRVGFGGRPRWEYLPEVEFEVVDGQTTDVTIDVPVIHRALRVVDDAGQPLPNLTVKVGAPDDPLNATELTTDANGELALVVPAGGYALYRQIAGSEPFEISDDVFTAFDWSQGEDALVVALPKSPD